MIWKSIKKPSCRSSRKDERCMCCSIWLDKSDIASPSRICFVDIFPCGKTYCAKQLETYDVFHVLKVVITIVFRKRWKEDALEVINFEADWPARAIVVTSWATRWIHHCPVLLLWSMKGSTIVITKPDYEDSRFLKIKLQVKNSSTQIKHLNSYFLNDA